ncbi:MAG: VOC family protein [Terrimesophilobacter sp.]
MTVADIDASRAFYEKLGFTKFGGEPAENWLIMKNGDSVVGLFQGMFETNMLTFNPGWDGNAEPLDSFADVRTLQRELQDAVVSIVTAIDEKGSGPGSILVVDPDGNPILIDQHS